MCSTARSFLLLLVFVLFAGVYFGAVKALDFYNEMLSWPRGGIKEDGVWAKHWYKSVLDSTAFKPYEDKELKLKDDEKNIVDQAMPIYESLYKFVI